MNRQRAIETHINNDKLSTITKLEHTVASRTAYKWIFPQQPSIADRRSMGGCQARMATQRYDKQHSNSLNYNNRRASICDYLDENLLLSQ